MESGRPVLRAGVTIPKTDRQRISVLATSYRDKLSPGRDNRRELAVVLAKLLAGFPAPASGETSTELRIAAYLEAVETIPAWAVDAARQAITRGETDADPRFAPTPPQLARLARQAMEPIGRIVTDLERIAAAAEQHEPDDAERVRIAAGLAAFRAELAGASARDAPERARDRFAEMCAEAGVDPDSVPDAPERRGSFNRIGRAG